MADLVPVTENTSQLRSRGGIAARHDHPCFTEIDEADLHADVVRRRGEQGDEGGAARGREIAQAETPTEPHAVQQ